METDGPVTPVWGMSVGIDSQLVSTLASSTDIKRVQTQHTLFRVSELILLYNSLVRRQSSSLSPSSNLNPCLSSGNSSWRLFQKSQEKTIEGFDCKINGRARGLVGLASKNTGHFWVSGSRCWPRQACLRKNCYHSCKTHLVLESKMFWCFVNFGPWQVTADRYCFHAKCNFW